MGKKLRSQEIEKSLDRIRIDMRQWFSLISPILTIGLH